MGQKKKAKLIDKENLVSKGKKNFLASKDKVKMKVLKI
jgi:hypothetical protein